MSKHLLRAAEIAAMPKKQIQHQFNNNAIRLTRSLSTALGLQRLGLHLVTLEPVSYTHLTLPTKA